MAGRLLPGLREQLQKHLIHVLAESDRRIPVMHV